jgi:hypothetical protein
VRRRTLLSQHVIASHPQQLAHWEGKAIRSFLTVTASAVALCGCAAQPMHWAKPDTTQATFKQRFAQDAFKHDTFKQRLGETPRRGKKVREAAGATAEALSPSLTKE